MPTLPTADWTATLDQMSRTLDQALAAFDRHQQEWAPIADESALTTSPGLLLTGLETRLNQWDARLNAAAALAASVENELVGRQADVEQWLEGFVKWKEMLQRVEDRTGSSPR